MASRFGNLNDDDIEEIIKNKDKKNTKKVVEKSVQVLRSYLQEKNMPDDFENLPEDELDNVLMEFYANARTKSGAFYKINSMDNLRYGISKYLKDSKSIDINSEAFSSSNESFKAV